MIRKLKLWERLIIAPATILLMPMLLITMYPVLVVAAAYLAVKGEYEQDNDSNDGKPE